AMRLCGSRLAYVAAFLIVPRSSVVGLRGRIKSRVETVLRQFETLVHDESSAGVIEQVILSYAVILDGVVDHSAEECNVGADSNLKEEIRGRRGARKARIDYDHLCVASLLGFDGPLEAAGMILGRISAHDQHHVVVLDVDPAIRHGPASKCWSQT